MTDLVLSPIFDTIIESLVSPLTDEVRMIWKVDDDLDTLTNALKKIQCVLADAEEMQITKRAVKNWLGELKDVAYDADDVLDELAFEALRRVADGESSQGKRRKVWSFLTLPFNGIRLDIAYRIKVINEKFERLSRERQILSLREDDGRRVIKHIDQLPRTSSLMIVPELEVIGRKKDVKQIIDLVVPEDVSCGKDVSVISIVGMGGLGKTTLAQLIYNNEKVEKHFQVRAWVCVSEDFDILRLTKDIIESAKGGKCDSLAIDPLQRNLQKILSGNRFLIALDDVWNEDRNAWDRLKAPFCFGAKGSIIIVTTRVAAVSRAMDTDHDYILDHLAYDDCLSLFLRHAFKGENCDAHPKLKEVGKELVQKRCQGLPLAAKALGSLLSDERDVDHWKRVLKSHIWRSMENETMKALRVSYHHFPPQIKQCFAYCFIFPKDYEFTKEDLIKLWMAQGFILPENGKDLETIGSEYFDFLLLRSFFQRERSNHLDQNCKMHDCIHDLAISISRDECLRIEHDKPTYNPDKGHRHSSFIVDDGTDIVNLEGIYKCKGLRTLIVQRYSSWWNTVNLDNKVICDLILNFRCLRVLILSHLRQRELPCSISNLKHLRYLDLQNGLIKQLPESLSSLYNLQTLNLRFCYYFCQLPKETRKLQNLRHLDLFGCDSLKSMPPEMGKLTCLRTLSRFIVGKESGHKIGELKHLMELRGNISIAKLQNVANAKEVAEVNLKSRPQIVTLRLDWDDKDDASMNPQDQASFGEDELGKIFEALQPHTNIKGLAINGYRGNNYPSWLQDMMLPNLQYLTLLNCANCNSLPPLGRMLHSLTVHGMNGVKCISQEFYGNRQIKGFPLLKTLRLVNMPNLEEWCEFQEGEYPCLEHLTIAHCPKLMKMPDYFPTLRFLDVNGCFELACLPKLPSLIYLKLGDCDEILLQCVPHLTSISNLEIENITSLPRGMLQSLDNLKSLTISWCQKLVSLLEEDGLQDKGLPPNLTLLRFFHCESLKALPKGLWSLISLKKLIIEECPQVIFLPEEELPNTLQHLRIDKCEKLRERCRKDDGEDWARIAHIPLIEIDGNMISRQ